MVIGDGGVGGVGSGGSGGGDERRRVDETDEEELDKSK